MEKEEKITEQKSYTTITTIEIETQQIKWLKKVTIFIFGSTNGLYYKEIKKKFSPREKIITRRIPN